MTIEEHRALWEPVGVYCNTASYGLPPRPAWDALQAALADWHGGRTSWEDWGHSTEGARAAFARLTAVKAAQVAVGSTVSELVGSVVTALPAGARVVVPDVEFTSVLFPLLVQARLDVRTVPPSRLAEAIGDGADVAAFSAVQMSTGEARGSAMLAVSERLLEHAVPHNAGWYAGEDVHASLFGPPLRLASSARRLDLSPAWFSWVGTQPALELIERIGVEAIHAHDVGLANRFRAGLGLEPGNSAIVSAEVPEAAQRLERAGIVAALRGGRLRTSWHVYNDEADVDRVLEALA
ncbi:MAG: hypothetical protein MSC31_02825 [Solirubrobacteraceae bacterium MAG38_C4-C5]|nr:hypothetical protein [Candidatus Siliceabacter maunaloa]